MASIALPKSYLAQRFPIGKFCGVSIAVWGGITMTTAGYHICRSYGARVGAKPTACGWPTSH